MKSGKYLPEHTGAGQKILVRLMFICRHPLASGRNLMPNLSFELYNDYPVGFSQIDFDSANANLKY